MRQNLKEIQDQKIYPPQSPDITVVRDIDTGSYFIKWPKLLCLDNEDEAKLVPQMFIDEIKTLEKLKTHPHTNFVRYFGCTVRRGRVTGIVLERHDILLQYRHEDDPRYLDINACMEGIRAGIKHLHELGFAQ